MELNANEYTCLEWVGDGPDVVTAGNNDPWFAPANLKLMAHSLGLGVIGTGDVTIDLLVNASSVATLTATGGSFSGLQPLNVVLAPGDRIDVNVTAAGTGHENIIYQLFYEA